MKLSESLSEKAIDINERSIKATEEFLRNETVEINKFLYQTALNGFYKIRELYEKK